MKDLIIPAEVVQALGNYLAGRPWGEVNALIQALQSLRPATEKEEEVR